MILQWAGVNYWMAFLCVIQMYTARVLKIRHDSVERMRYFYDECGIFLCKKPSNFNIKYEAFCLKSKKLANFFCKNLGNMHSKHCQTHTCAYLMTGLMCVIFGRIHTLASRDVWIA